VGLRDLFRRGGYSSPEEGDQLVLEQLRSAGADLTKPREVLHYLHARTREDAERAAPQVRAAGYEVELREPDPEDLATSHPWIVIATTHAVVSSDSVAETRAFFERVAGEVDGEYDGWEAAVD